MSNKRRSFEAGHKRKYLVVVDDTEECERAVYWATKRANRTASQVVMLRVIEIADRNQQWLGVADIMQAEAMEAANAALDKFFLRRRVGFEKQPAFVQNSEEVIAGIQAVRAKHRLGAQFRQRVQLVEDKFFERVVRHIGSR